VETSHNTIPAQSMRIMDWIKEYLKTGKAPENLVQKSSPPTSAEER
jgi:hypothetical protein